MRLENDIIKKLRQDIEIPRTVQNRIDDTLKSIAGEMRKKDILPERKKDSST